MYDFLFGILIRMFYYLFGSEMRHLHTGGNCPVASGQGYVIMTSFGPSLGGQPNAAEAMPNFAFFSICTRQLLGSVWAVGRGV